MEKGEKGARKDTARPGLGGGCGDSFEVAAGDMEGSLEVFSLQALLVLPDDLKTAENLTKIPTGKVQQQQLGLQGQSSPTVSAPHPSLGNPSGNFLAWG